ncbi:MAG: STAS domain-containing protein [Methylococcaceae bacterium]
MAIPKNKKQQCQPIVIDGELTIYTATELKEKLLAGLLLTEELELDLSGVCEVDAAGLQLLVMIKQEAVVLGKVLHFTAHSPVVVELLDLSGLAGFFGDPLLMVHSSSTDGVST